MPIEKKRGVCCRGLYCIYGIWPGWGAQCARRGTYGRVKSGNETTTTGWSGRKALIFGPTDRKQTLSPKTYPNPSGAAGVTGALVYLVLRFVISAQATLLMQTFSVTDLLLVLEPDGVLTNERIFA